MSRVGGSSDLEDLDGRPQRGKEEKSEEGRPGGRRRSASGSSSPRAAAGRGTGLDSPTKTKKRPGLLRQSSEGKLGEDGNTKSGSGPVKNSGDTDESIAWIDVHPGRVGTADSIVSTHSDISLPDNFKLSRPVRRGNTKSSLPGFRDDDLTSIESYSDSAASQNSIPDVPGGTRARTGSLTAFNRQMLRHVFSLEDNPSSGISPPHSIRDGTSYSSLNAGSRGPTAKSSQASLASPRGAIPALGPDGEVSPILLNARTTAVEWLIEAVLNDHVAAQSLDQIIRNRDLCENRRPYERLLHTFVNAPNQSFSRIVLDLINVLIGDITLPHRAELFDGVENTSFFSGLRKLLSSEHSVGRHIAKSFQRYYIEFLMWQSMVNWDPQDPTYAFKLVVFLKVCEPLNCFAPAIWSTCSRLAFRALLHMADNHILLLRKILDENEAQTPDRYCLPVIASPLAAMLNEFITQHIPLPLPRLSLVDHISSSELDEPTDSEEGISSASSSRNAEPTPVGNNILAILFSGDDGYNELFATALLVFDTVWKELKATTNTLEAVLIKTKQLLGMAFESTTDMATFKNMLLVGTKLAPRPTPPPPAAIPTHMRSVWRRSLAPMTPGELCHYFIELIRFISLPAEKSLLPLLPDAVAAMRTIASQPLFPWDVVSTGLLFHLLRNIGGSDAMWVRQPHLSSQVALWIEYQLSADPKGPAKVVSALEMIAKDHSTGYCLTKPLVRMLRTNRQLSVPLRIINRIFEFKNDEAARKEYISDLARSQALSIMKSKVWSTFSEVKAELLRFQANLLSLDPAKFEPGTREHEAILSECWHAGFPLLKLKHVGPQQWAVLGFRKATSMVSFRGIPIKALQHLLHFARVHNTQFQHLALCTHQNVFPVADFSISLSATLLRLFTSDDYLMPMIFDEDHDGFAEIHGIVLLWMTQAWLMDTSLQGDALLNKTEAHLITVMKSSKPANSEEFSSQLGVSLDLMNASWHKQADKGHHPTPSNTPPLLAPHASSRSLLVSPDLLSSSSSSLSGINTPKGGRKITGTPDLEASSSPALSAATSPLNVPQIPASEEAVPDFLQDYLLEHKNELDHREYDLSEYIDAHNKDFRRGRQRGSSRAERDLVEAERLSRNIASTRIAFEPETVAPAADDDKSAKELIKLRKSETKELKDFKAYLAKQKFFRL